MSARRSLLRHAIVGVVDLDDDVVGRGGEDAPEVLEASELLDGGDDDERLRLRLSGRRLGT